MIKTKKTKVFVIVLTILTAVLTLYWLAIKNIVHSEYSGIIENIITDEKGYPKVEVVGSNHMHYVFQANTGQLKIGDSLVKRRNELDIKHYRDGQLITIYNAIW